MIEIVSATRHATDTFWTQSSLGLSLKRLSFDTRLKPCITFKNQKGLPEIYNCRISAAGEHDLLVFLHDDVWIDDFFFADHVIQGLREYDIIGIAGNRRKVPNQPAWAFIDDQFTWDSKENLSGSVAHGATPFGSISHYGDVPADCELLDGVLLAAAKSSLQKSSVLFDPAFDFHFYDLDFCRTARKKGLRLGTWHISITHNSGGSYGSPAWTTKRDEYRRKWKD